MENRNGKEKEVKGGKGGGWEGGGTERERKKEKRTGAREEFSAVVIFS